MPKVIGYHCKDGLLVASDGWQCSSKPVTSLLSRCTQEKNIHIACHLDYFVAQILKMVEMDEESLRKLWLNTEIVIPPFRISYIPRKFLALSEIGWADDNFFVICDANQYEYWSFSQDIGSQDPIIGARFAQQAGQKIYDALIDLGLNPSTLVSPIRAWEKEHWDELDVPTIDDLPELVSQYSYACCHGNWVECFYKGHFAEAYDYDLNSAYTAVAAELLDTRVGQWIHNSKYQPDAVYGYALGDLSVYVPFHPILMTIKNNGSNENYTPTGIREAILPKSKIDYIDKYKIGSFKINDAVWWKPDEEIKPLKSHIWQLFSTKDESEGAKREVVKRILNGGFYGKFIQLKFNGELGEHFMPVYAAEIESRTQIRIAETCLLNKVIPISLAVDGVVTNRKLSILNSKALGGWRCSSTGPVLAVSSGVVALSSHIPDKDFSLDYEWLMQQIKDNPDKSEYSKQKWGPITLGKACNDNRIGKLGSLEQTTKTVDIKFEKKRIYPQFPTTGGELLKKVYASLPKDASMLKI